MVIFTAILKALAAWAGLILAVWLTARGAFWLRGRIMAWHDRRIAERQVRGARAILLDQGLRFVLGIAKAGILFVIVLQISVLLSYTFSLFPATSGISTTLLDTLTHALGTVVTAFVHYLPNLAMLAVIAFFLYYVLRILRVFFWGVERGDIQIRGFYTDWAQPTFELVRFLLIVFAIVVAFPYLPGSQTGALQGVSIFFGVLITFGSSSAVSNVVAGVFLTYMRPFKNGDRVNIGGTFGDVVERNLLVTRVRTIKNEDVTVPNATILGGQILNYSAQAKSAGLILHTSVTIGYDAPWRHVHQLLISAALATKGVSHEPAPFVFQTALNDFNVTYEINAYTGRPNDSHFIYAELHENIQEKFNEAGIEIMSPSYLALRDGNTLTIPETQRPEGYQSPAFKIKTTN